MCLEKLQFKINPNIKQLASNTFKYHVFAPMGRFQLELIYLYFPPSSHLIYVCFCPFVVITTFSTGLVGVVVTSVWTPTRPVEDVVITTKGVQDRNIHILDERTVENKGKLILTSIKASSGIWVQLRIYF